MATFGKTSAPASSSNSSTDKVVVSRAVPASDGTITTGHAYLHLDTNGTSSTCKFVIYASNGAGGGPGTRLAESNTITLNSSTSPSAYAQAVRTFTFSGANLIDVTGGTAYWIGPAYSDPGNGTPAPNVVFGRDALPITDVANQRREGTITWPTVTSPTWAGAQVGPMAAYVTFTPASATITGTVAIALGAPVLAAAGTVVPEVVTGTVAIALGAPTLAAAGTAIPEVVTGTVAIAVGAPSLAATGTVVHEIVTGSVAAEIGAPVLAVAGTTIPEVVTGTVVMTVGAPTLGVIGTTTPEVVTGTVAIEVAAPELTASGTASLPVTGNAVRFDEASDRVTYAGAMPDPVDGFTATWWAYLSVDRDDYSAFFRLWANGSTTATIETIDNGTSPGYFTAGGSVLSLTPMTVGVWHRIAVTCSGTTAHVYSAAGTDGTTGHASGTVAGAPSPNGITLGGRHPDDDTESYNGRLACLRIWDRVLTQTEIEAEWVSWTPVVADEPWANWLLDDPDDLRDWSGNGRHLVAGATPVTAEDGPPIAGAPPVVVTGSVGLAVDAPAVTAAGTVVAEVVTGAVTLVASAPTLAAAGTVVAEVVTGSVALAVPAPAVTAAGTAIAQVVTGSVALDVGAPALVATGTAASEIVTGSVSLDVAAPTVTATGIVVHEVITGTVHVTVGAPVVTVTGFRVIDGVVEIDLGPLTLTAEGLAFDPDARPPVLHAGTPAVGVGLRAGEPITVRLLVGTPTVTSLRAGTPTVTRLRAGAPITA